MMSTVALTQIVAAAQLAVTRQGDTVRSLKASLKEGKAEKADVDAAIKQLSALKADLSEHQKAIEAVSGKALSSSSREVFRAAVINALETYRFFMPSFAIYGSVAGFYDFGPNGCKVKQNITQYWRQHFVLEENMLEVECPAVTPEIVLKASGHVERFTDLMVTDMQTGDCHRADHLLEHHLEALLEDDKKPLPPETQKEIKHVLTTVEELEAAGLGNMLTAYGVKAPETGNELSQPFPFNLMFKTSIGPRSDQVGYLRPETAQGIFVNFRDLYYHNGNKLPFAAAQIGQSYRNEISPRQGLLRVREFTQAEIEHFCNPDNKAHSKFAEVAQETPLLYSREVQMSEDKTPQPTALGSAVSAGTIANETLAYFIGRTYLFLRHVGIDPERMRFRQHLRHEMAHYAEDCWDAEVECSYGWVECVGLADRSAFDLRAHAAKSKKDMSAREAYPEPRLESVVVVAPNKQLLGRTFARNAKPVQEYLERMDDAEALCLKESLDAGKSASVSVGSTEFPITPDMVKISKQQKKVTGRTFIPSVIEPSFGLGRIMYCLFEHAFYHREGDEKRTVFRFQPVVAPFKATVLPLLQKETMNAVAQKVSAQLTRAALYNVIDTTGTSIGKRYARTDAIGVPFAITVDAQTLEDNTVTLRERDSTAQVRLPIDEVTHVLKQLTETELCWEQVAASYPAQQTADGDA